MNRRMLRRLRFFAALHNRRARSRPNRAASGSAGLFYGFKYSEKDAHTTGSITPEFINIPRLHGGKSPSSRLTLSGSIRVPSRSKISRALVR